MRNIEASVRARLKNLASAQSVTMQRLLTLYMQEGLLHRITSTAYRDKVVLKGGLLFYLRYGTAARTTKDIALHGHDMVCDTQTMESMLNAAVEHEMDDGLTFDPVSLRAEPIRGQEGVVGVRGHIRGYLGNARNDLQIDMGCGDVITGGPITIEYPTLLENRSFSIEAYSTETMLAEKLSALVTIGVTNSRTRDLYDMYVLLVEENHDPSSVAQAATNTFRNRSIETPAAPTALTIEHWSSEDFASFWNAFLKQVQRDDPSVSELKHELLPLVQDIYAQVRSRIEGEK